MLMSFAFGIFALSNGMNIFESLMISMTNVTSAGQLAGVPIIAAGGSLFELALSQLVINLRYALMSVSLSQKLGKSIRFVDRFIIAFVNTDEVFAVATSNKESVGRNYMFGLILTPYFGWALGTLCGAIAGDLLPPIVISSLGIAIYAMFVAIVVPPSKKSHGVALCAVLAIVLSVALEYLPYLKNIPDGFAIILCAVIASGIFALVLPKEVDADE